MHFSFEKKQKLSAVPFKLEATRPLSLREKEKTMPTVI
jgi:hypothetical protein